MAIDFVNSDQTEKRTLGDILRLLDAVDECFTEITEFEAANLAKECMQKIDSMRFVLDSMQMRWRLAEKYEKEHEKRKTAMENSWHRLRKYIAREMEINGFQQLPGNEWRVQKIYKPRVIIMAEADSDLYFKLQRDPLAKLWIKRTYRWNKIPLGDAVKKGHSLAQEIAKIEHNPHVKFWPKK